MKTLRELSILQNGIRTGMIEVFDAISCNQSLESLDLSDNYINTNETRLKLKESLTKLQNIVKLELADCQLGRVEELVDLLKEGLNDLTLINIEHNEITNGLEELLAQLRIKSRLESVLVKGNEVSEEA